MGTMAEKTYSGSGTLTVVAHFGTTLSGSVWRNAVIEVLFQGITSGAASNQVARYYIPVSGLSVWALGTPTLIYGATLTILQTANSSSTVTFTVAGGNASQIVSIYVMGTHNAGFFLE